jgi:phosphoglycerate dehydrogenase-like enzyme
MYTIWCNASLTLLALDELKRSCGENRVIVSAQPTGNLSAGQPDLTLAEADIAFGQPDPVQIIELPKLKWIHLSSAGYTRYDTPKIRAALKNRGAMLTNSSSVFSEPCAQHALAFMLSGARQLPAAFANQAGGHGWPINQLRMQSHLLTEQTVLILSLGSIARRLVELLTPLRMKMMAVRQTPRGDETIPTYPNTELDRLLPRADHVMNILPDSPSTQRFFNAKRFALLKPGAIFYNIGRGTTVDQTALLTALKTGNLTAYLDVTDPEPLPPEHPLWSAPNCHITPHTAGGHAAEFSAMVQHFVENLRRFESGLGLRDRVM